MAYIFTTESEIQQKSGADVNVAFDTAMMEASANRSESTINCVARYDFSRNPLTLSTFAGILSDISSSMVAMEAISYDMDSYPSRAIAEDMIDVNNNIVQRGLGILRDKKVQKFMRGD